MSKQRLIDANKIKFCGLNKCICPDLTAQDVIDDAPTVDAVPVVRCGECKHSSPCPTDKNKLFCLQGKSGTGYKRVNKSHYCSYGKRRESEVSE